MQVSPKDTLVKPRQEAIFGQFRTLVILKDVVYFILAHCKGSDLCQSCED